MIPPDLLIDQDAPPAVQMVMNWLLPIADSPLHVGMIRRETSPLPYYQVGLIYFGDNAHEATAEADVSVHYMTDAREGVDADTLAIRGGDTMHRRMLKLARQPDSNITVAGKVYNIDFMDTVERPAWRDYDDTTMARVKAVYRLGLSFA